MIEYNNFMDDGGISNINEGSRASENTSEAFQSKLSDQTRSRYSELLGDMQVVPFSEMLEGRPAAERSDSAKFEAFPAHNRACQWLESRSYQGILEGRVSTKIPEGKCLMVLFQNEEMWVKWVKANYEAMQESVKIHRSQMKSTMYWQGIKSRFEEVKDQIYLERAERNKRSLDI